MKSLALLLFLSIFCKEDVFAWEYCNKKTVGSTCYPIFNHLMCHKENLFKEENLAYITTEWSEYMPITPSFRQKMIEIHDEYRNKVASGEEVSTKTGKNYPIASRFRELIWDLELQFLCHENIRMALTLKHDKCRGTVRFAYPGQNLAAGDLFTIPTPPTSGHRREYLQLVNDSLLTMYEEKDLIEDPPNFPQSLRNEDRKAGHYNQMVNDRSGRIGCASGVGINCTQPEPYAVYPACWYLCCNFEHTVEPESFVYKTHPTTPASECSQWAVGKSKKYKNLCGNSGRIFPPYELYNDTFFDARFDDVVDNSHLREIIVREKKHIRKKPKHRPTLPAEYYTN